LKTLTALLMFCIAGISYWLLHKRASLVGYALLTIIGAAIGLFIYDHL
jgi:hypothetical protein